MYSLFLATALVAGASEGQAGCYGCYGGSYSSGWMPVGYGCWGGYRSGCYGSGCMGGMPISKAIVRRPWAV